MHAYESLVRRIYQAALCPEDWPQTLKEIALCLDGECALIMFANPDAPVDMILSPGFEHIAKVYYEEEWWRRDLRVHRGPQILSERGVDAYTDHMVATAAEMETHPIYADFIPRTGLGWCMIATILPDLDMPVLVAVHRDKARGPFEDQAQLDRLVALSHHVEQALRISLRLTHLEAQEAMLTRAWDAMEIGLYALDAGGRLVAANSFGKRHFDTYFHLLEGRVRPVHARVRIPAASERTRAVDTGSAAPAPQIALGRDGSRIALWSIPIVEDAAPRLGLDGAAKILTLALPLESQRQVAPPVLRELFGLTLGEARLASLIGGGIALSAAAEELRITEGTARIVLKRVFRKLGVNRQAEIVLQMQRLGTITAGDGAPAR